MQIDDTQVNQGEVDTTFGIKGSWYSEVINVKSDDNCICAGQTVGKFCRA